MSTEIQTGKGLATYSNELLVADGSDLYSYNAGSDNWTDKGAFVSVQVEKSSVNHDSYWQLNPDGATDSITGYQAYMWENKDPTTSSIIGVYYTIIDSNTGQTMVPAKLLSANGIRPRVLSLPGRFLLYFYDSVEMTLKLALIPSSTPNATPIVSTLTAVAATVNGVDDDSSGYDVSIINTDSGAQIALVFNNAAGSTTLRLYTALNLTSSPLQTTIAKVSRALTVFPSTAGNNDTDGPVVALADTPTSTTVIWYFAYRADLTLIMSGQLASGGTYANSDVYGLTGCRTSTTKPGFEVYWYQAGTSRISQAKVDASYTVTLTLNWLLNCVTVAKAFFVNGKVHLPILYNRSSNVQRTLFIIRSDKEIVAKAMPGTAGGQQTATYYTTATFQRAPPCNVTVLDGAAFRFAASEQANLNGNGLQTLDGVAALTFDFDDEVHNYAHASLGNNLHFTGGFVQMYDGADVVEHGFHIYPIINATSTNTTGGSISPGTYSYVGCYEWIDQQNNVHRSRPSAVSTIVVPAGTTTNTVNVNFVCLQLTNKPANRPVQLVLYRTLAEGTILYRASSLTEPTLNAIGTQQVSITDKISDTNLAKQPQLYTQFLAGTATGQPYEVENDPAPPTKLIQLHRNRIWVVDSTNPLTLWYSKECGIGAPVEFNNSFTKQIDARGGPITALATIDDKLLVFKQSHIFFIVGQGPTNTNLQNDLSDAILVTTDVGCIDPRSIVASPVGLLFKSRKGIYLIDRGLQVQYIGAAVEAYNAETITSATLVADTNQVRFTLGNNTALVFDYFVQQWGVFTNHDAVDSIIWNSTFVYLRPNGQVLAETPGVYTDVGTPIQLKLTTSWLSFANVQGFQRVRRAQILGGWRSPHDLMVNVCVDFDDSIVQTSIIKPQTPSVYGESSPYGAESPYGGNFQLYQWRVDLARQKTQSVKFTIQDLPTGTAGEGCNLTSLAFEVGAKTGLNKVPAPQIVG